MNLRVRGVGSMIAIVSRFRQRCLMASKELAGHRYRNIAGERAIRRRQSRFRSRLLGSRRCHDPQRFGLPDDLGLRFGVGIGRCRRDHAQQFIVAGNQVTVFAQIANDQLGRLAYRRAGGNRTQLPKEVIRQIARFRQEVLKRGLFNFLHLAGAAITGVQILLEKRAEVDLFERILLFVRSDGVFFGRRLGCNAVAFFFLPPDLIEHWD